MRHATTVTILTVTAAPQIVYQMKHVQMGSAILLPARIAKTVKMTVAPVRHNVQFLEIVVKRCLAVTPKVRVRVQIIKKSAHAKIREDFVTLIANAALGCRAKHVTVALKMRMLALTILNVAQVFVKAENANHFNQRGMM